MSRFPDELKVIPVGAWAIASVLALGTVLCLQGFAIPKDPKLSNWPQMFQICFSLLMGLLLFVYTLLVGYVNGDASRRQMRAAMWTLLAIFIPNCIGIILYFIMRDPLPRGCPQCGVTVRSKGPFCPACGAALSRVCPSCQRAVEPGWSHCTGCGGALQHS